MGSAVDLIQTLRGTGAAREFEPDPVPDDVVARLLDTARFAPNGGNRQAWRVVLVHDRDTRRAIRELYLRHWYDYVSMSVAGLTPWAPVTDLRAEEHALQGAPAIAEAAAAGPGGFAEHLDDVPVMLVLLADLRRLAAVDRDMDRYTFVGGASVYPFAWSLLLAARAEGLGGVMTTITTRAEPAMRELLHVPDEFAVAALVALGRPRRQPSKLKREPVASFATVDHFDGPALEGPPVARPDGA